MLHVDDDPSFVDLTETYLTWEDERFVVETATTAGIVERGWEPVATPDVTLRNEIEGSLLADEARL